VAKKVPTAASAERAAGDGEWQSPRWRPSLVIKRGDDKRGVSMEAVDLRDIPWPATEYHRPTEKTILNSKRRGDVHPFPINFEP